jgi:hypothetical protein
MASRKENNDVTLETLLQLKRNERPGGEFWDSFERDFQRRRLHALLEKPTFRDSIWSSGVRALAFGLPALVLIGLSVMWSPGVQPSDKDLTASNPAPALETGIVERSRSQVVPVSEDLSTVSTSLASSQFVVDALESKPSSRVNFRKVLYTPAIRLSAPTGAFYVRDSLSSSNYRVTTADVKLGRNF